MHRLICYIKRIMELWRLYCFLRFVKHQIEIRENQYTQIINAYRQEKRLNDGAVNDLWEVAIEQNYLTTDGTTTVRLKDKGRRLTEMKGYGFIVVAIKQYGEPLVLLAGIASIINLLVVLI